MGIVYSGVTIWPVKPMTAWRLVSTQTSTATLAFQYARFVSMLRYWMCGAVDTPHRWSMPEHQPVLERERCSVIGSESPESGTPAPSATLSETSTVTLAKPLLPDASRATAVSVW